MTRRYEAIGNRLRQLRTALGKSQAELCREIKCSTNRWNQYESGERQITVVVANRLVDDFGVTLDWIYRGDHRGIRHELHEKMHRTAA